MKLYPCQPNSYLLIYTSQTITVTPVVRVSTNIKNSKEKLLNYFKIEFVHLHVPEYQKKGCCCSQRKRKAAGTTATQSRTQGRKLLGPQTLKANYLEPSTHVLYITDVEEYRG